IDAIVGLFKSLECWVLDGHVQVLPQIPSVFDDVKQEWPACVRMVIIKEGGSCSVIPLAVTESKVPEVREWCKEAVQTVLINSSRLCERLRCHAIGVGREVFGDTQFGGSIQHLWLRESKDVLGELQGRYTGGGTYETGIGKRGTAAHRAW